VKVDGWMDGWMDGLSTAFVDHLRNNPSPFLSVVVQSLCIDHAYIPPHLLTHTSLHSLLLSRMKLQKIHSSPTEHQISPHQEAAWLGYKHSHSQIEDLLSNSGKQHPLMGSGGAGRKFRGSMPKSKEESERFWTMVAEQVDVDNLEAIKENMIKGGHGVPLSGQFCFSSFVILN
jgi:hypothetical protein